MAPYHDVVLHPGEVRARVLWLVHQLVHEVGLTVADACREVARADRTTIYRWAGIVRGHPREEWPELLQSAKLRVSPDTLRAQIWRSIRMLCTVA